MKQYFSVASNFRGKNVISCEKHEREFKVNCQQLKSVWLRPVQKIPTPIEWIISPLPEVINQICKKHSLENSYDKKTSKHVIFLKMNSYTLCLLEKMLNFA